MNRGPADGEPDDQRFVSMASINCVCSFGARAGRFRVRRRGESGRRLRTALPVFAGGAQYASAAVRGFPGRAAGPDDMEMSSFGFGFTLSGCDVQNDNVAHKGS